MACAAASWQGLVVRKMIDRADAEDMAHELAVGLARVPIGYNGHRRESRCRDD
jgi:hypothetical protein